MPNHEERELTRINMDVSFVWERDLWDHQITAHAIVNVPGMDERLHVSTCTSSISSYGEPTEVESYGQREVEGLWYRLTRRVMRDLERQGKWPSFPGLAQENEVKPCPFEAKD